MTTLYVATDTSGVQHLPGFERAWPLPEAIEAGRWRQGSLAAVAEGEHDLVLFDAAGLLDELGERIFVANAPAGPKEPDESGALHVRSAYLVAETAWDLETTATFALDCAEHVLGEAATLELPGGMTIGSLLAEARQFLTRAADVDEHRLGFFARLAAARRLHHRQEDLGDVARSAIGEDLEKDLDLLEDPAWTTIASMSNALLAAIEVLRHLAFPRYVAARERSFDPDDDSEPGTSPGFISTPWGLAPYGGEWFPEYVPAYVPASDAAGRARLSVADRAGEDAANAERSWQAEHLEHLLRGS